MSLRAMQRGTITARALAWLAPIRRFALLGAWFAFCAPAFAGGPILVGGPNFGRDAQPFTWDPAKMPVQYTVETGPLSTGTVSIGNAAALQRVQAMFAVWSSVPTAAISFSYAGPVLSSSGVSAGDVSTIAQFNDVIGTCNNGTQSPIMFDADGSLNAALGVDPGVIGFTQPCKFDAVTGFIDSAAVLMNGAFLGSGRLTDGQFNTAITHELGHFSGLGHSQINVEVLTDNPHCTDDLTAGLPLMFPILECPRPLDANNNPTLSPDDIAWISHLYPNSKTPGGYGLISGIIFFSDGITHAQGVNVVARAVDDPNTPQDESLRVAVSAVSGYLFTGNPGQSITGDNIGGNPDGSRSGQWIGYYEIPVPPGTYTVQIESVNAAFVGGSSVGPLDPPVPLLNFLGDEGSAKYWQVKGTPFDYPLQRSTLSVSPGQSFTNINVIENVTAPRFDQFEDSGALRVPDIFKRDSLPGGQG